MRTRTQSCVGQAARPTFFTILKKLRALDVHELQNIRRSPDLSLYNCERVGRVPEELQYGTS